VTTPDKKPAPGIRVWLRESRGRLPPVITDRQGRYRFIDVPPGGAFLQICVDTDDPDPNNRAVAPFEIEAGKTLKFGIEVPKQ